MNIDRDDQRDAAARMAQHEPGWYEICLQGRLDKRWSAWFDGMAISTGTGGTTVLRGHVADQAELHGQLSRLRDLGLPLISVARVPTPPDADDPADEDDGGSPAHD
jgi:hypothetical protein